MTYAEKVIKREIPDDVLPPNFRSSSSSSSPRPVDHAPFSAAISAAAAASKAGEKRSFKAKMLNVSKVKRSRRWLKNVMLSDSSSEDDGEDDDDDDDSLSEKRLKKWKKMGKCSDAVHASLVMH